MIGPAGPVRRFIFARRGIVALIAIVAAFSVPIAAVIGYAAQRRGAVAVEAALHQSGLDLLEPARVFERRLRQVRSHAIARHRITTQDRAPVDGALVRLGEAVGSGSVGPAVSRRFHALANAWDRVSDRRRDLHDIDVTLAAANDFDAAVAMRASLRSAPDEESENAIELYVDVLPAIDDRIDQERNLIAAALGAPRVSVTNRFALEILADQRSRAYDAATQGVQRIGPRDGRRRLLEALRRLGFAASRFDAEVRYVLGRRTHTKADRTRIARRGDDVARNIDATAAQAATIASAGYTRIRSAENAAFDRTRDLALSAWLFGVVLTATTAYSVYRRERRAGQHLYGNVVQRLALTQAQLEAIFENSTFGVAVLDRSGTIVRHNSALSRLIETGDIAAVGALDPRFAELVAGTRGGFSMESEREAAGRTRYLLCECSAVKHPGGDTTLVLAIVRDATEHREAEIRMRYEAHHDPVSRLPNRTQFLERLGRVFENVEGAPHAVAFLDLRSDATVSTLGYTGDVVLAALAARLASSVEPNDFVARFDGSTFVVLLEGRNRSNALEAVENLIRRVTRSLTIGERDDVHVIACVGVAIADRSQRDPLAVLRDAELAMYDAQTAGVRVSIFSPAMRDRAARRLALVSQLRRALERDQFYLVFQPIITAATGAICGFEALARWEHPELGNVPPMEFIPLAEEIGTIGALGRWVLERACAQLASWRGLGIIGERACKMAVNVSVRELLAPDYTAYVARTLGRHEIAPASIVLEITESAVLFGDSAAAEALARLRTVGVDLAIDDFGTGYSSLRYLHDFPFQELKIDGSFVRGADGDLAAKPIVTMLVALAKSLDVAIVAEGVETLRQAEALIALGVDSLQGYYFGRPVSAALVPEYLRGIVASAASRLQSGRSGR